MSVYYFPEGDPKFTNVIAYSPIALGVCPQKPFGDVSAEEFFDFAKADLRREGRSGLVDAFGNAKRCFHYQVDKLLYRFGLRSSTSELPFPVTIDLLSDLDIIPVTLLRVFNRERNSMEHDYSSPKKEIVESSIDLCELLFLATDRYLFMVPAKMRVVLKNDQRDLMFSLDPGSNCIEKFVIKGSTIQESKYGKIYKESLFELSSDKLTKGLTIESLPKEKIELKLENKEQWIPALRMFSSTARHSGRESPHLREPVLTIQHQISMKEGEELLKIMQAVKELKTGK
jgi:hypothetical protein